MCLAPFRELKIFQKERKKNQTELIEKQRRAVDDEVSVADPNARDPIGFNGEKLKRKNVENFDIFKIEKGKSEVALGESKN